MLYFSVMFWFFSSDFVPQVVAASAFGVGFIRLGVGHGYIIGPFLVRIFCVSFRSFQKFTVLFLFFIFLAFLLEWSHGRKY